MMGFYFPQGISPAIPARGLVQPSTVALLVGQPNPASPPGMDPPDTAN